MDATKTMNLKPEFTLKSQGEPRLTVWTLIWAGFWTGALGSGFVLLLR